MTEKPKYMNIDLRGWGDVSVADSTCRLQQSTAPVLGGQCSLLTLQAPRTYSIYIHAGKIHMLIR